MLARLLGIGTHGHENVDKSDLQSRTKPGIASTPAIPPSSSGPPKPGSIKNHPHESVFAITMHGSFSDRNISTWGDSNDVKINEIALLIDSRTGTGTDAWWGSNAQLRDNPMDLSKLGHVIQLPSRPAASAAVRRVGRASPTWRIRNSRLIRVRQTTWHPAAEGGSR